MLGMPKPCDPKIYREGTLVMSTHTIPPALLETWVKQVAARSGQPVDWHYCGGRACILASGNLDQVRAAIRELLPEHDRLQRDAARKYLAPEHFQPCCTLFEENEGNPAHEIARGWNTEAR